MNTTDSDTARDRALALLDGFCQRVLPGALNRIAGWKGVRPQSLLEWTDDVRQELALDCLQHTAEVLDLSDRERHSRWMRGAERTIYRLRRRERGLEAVLEEPSTPAGQAAPWPRVQLPRLVSLNNGRPNLVASTRENGRGRRELRQQLDRLAAELGWDDEQHRFWRARAAEALTGLAADLLRLRQRLHLLDEPPQPPLPQRRLRRLRHLWHRFPVQPSTSPVRRALRPWVRGRSLDAATPRQLLEQAVRLRPDAAAGWLWLFEACCATGDVVGAIVAIRGSRKCDPPMPTGQVLARARLLEQRGRLVAGMHLLRRASLRRPHDTGLLRALAACRRDPPADRRLRRR